MARKRVASKWIRNEADERAVARGYTFDERAAERVARFAQLCRHPHGRGAGEPFTLLPWQYDEVIAPMYGWKRPDHTRRVRRAIVFVPKKNGKTELCSMLSLYHLLADSERGAVVANAACDREQASLCFDAAATMVRSSRDLSAAIEIVDSKKRMVHQASHSTYLALASDAATNEGANLSALILDELHRWRPELFLVLHHAGAARLQPMFISISTAGVYDPASIAWQQYQYAKGILDASIDDLATFAYVREADAALDWTAPETWRAANPSINVTVTEEELAEQCSAAQYSVGLENAFRRYRLNQWTQSTERWLPLSTFDASAGHPIIEADYVGRKFYAGIDLGSVSDLSVVAYLFECPHTPGALDLVLRCFLPEAALREGKNALLFEQWRRDGHLIVTPGNVTDEVRIVDTVTRDAATFGCHSIGIDRLFQAMRLSQDLAARDLQVFPCGMGSMSLSPLVNELEKRLLGKTFHHGGHPVLRNAIDAVEMEVDAAGNRKPSRRDRSKKIDALIAVLLALDRTLRAPVVAPAPQYQMMIFGTGR